MNAHTFPHDASTQAPLSAKPTPWPHTPTAQRLIASLRANPPEMVERTEHYPLGDDRWTEFAPDSRIERLRIIANEAFLAAERADPEHGAQAFLDTQPGVDDVLASIGGHEKLFLGERVNRAWDGLLPDMLARHPLQSSAGMAA